MRNFVHPRSKHDLVSPPALGHQTRGGCAPRDGIRLLSVLPGQQTHPGNKGSLALIDIGLPEEYQDIGSRDSEEKRVDPGAACVDSSAAEKNFDLVWGSSLDTSLSGSISQGRVTERSSATGHSAPTDLLALFMDSNICLENKYSSQEERRSPYSTPDSAGLTPTDSNIIHHHQVPQSPNMFDEMGQICLPKTGILSMYDPQHPGTNLGPTMTTMDSNCHIPPDSQTNRNVILNQAESTLPSEVTSPVSLASSIPGMTDNYATMRPPAVTRVPGIFNGSEVHEVAAAVSTALTPDSNNLERVNQSSYQLSGQVMHGMPDKAHVISTNTSRKPTARTSKKKKKKDPHEPQKPVSAYALFFRDTQASIKVQKPNASFGEVSKIVASMWDTLNQDRKNEYKKQTEVAKKEYLKLLADYKASHVSRTAQGKNSREPHFHPGDEYGHYHVDEVSRRNNSPRPNAIMNESMYNAMQQHRIPASMPKSKAQLFSPPMMNPDSQGVVPQGPRSDVTGVSLPHHSPLQVRKSATVTSYSGDSRSSFTLTLSTTCFPAAA
ncbi:unnamed protein product [Notodromas monacha]|uniref:HMG box domain-containing protein n=1 Tax=Notodromas monacha TaxID=399045 RepID=A0A7R9BCM6_9CRUS|nr:unnamed protein product [Notodromas monacha]CAG0912218.1 unnamed protein product [Notodromas monacha]